MRPTPKQILESKLKLAGLTQAGIAEKLGVSKTTMNYWVNNFPDIKYPKIVEIAKVLNITAADLLKEVEEVSVEN